MREREGEGDKQADERDRKADIGLEGNLKIEAYTGLWHTVLLFPSLLLHYKMHAHNKAMEFNTLSNANLSSSRRLFQRALLTSRWQSRHFVDGIAKIAYRQQQ